MVILKSHRCDTSKLKLNVSKTKLMDVGKRNRISNGGRNRVQIVLEDELVRSTRYLGVYVAGSKIN